MAWLNANSYLIVREPSGKEANSPKARQEVLYAFRSNAKSYIQKVFVQQKLKHFQEGFDINLYQRVDHVPLPAGNYTKDMMSKLLSPGAKRILAEFEKEEP